MRLIVQDKYTLVCIVLEEEYEKMDGFTYRICLDGHNDRT